MREKNLTMIQTNSWLCRKEHNIHRGARCEKELKIPYPRGQHTQVKEQSSAPRTGFVFNP